MLLFVINTLTYPMITVYYQSHVYLHSAHYSLLQYLCHVLQYSLLIFFYNIVITMTRIYVIY